MTTVKVNSTPHSTAGWTLLWGENLRDHSAVWTKLGLVESVFAVLAHQVVWMRSVRLVLGHQVNAHFPFPAVIQNLWRQRRI